MRAAGSADTTSSRSKAHMFQAGFASIEITPAVGTPLMGWGRPADRLATAVHDPLFARALWVQRGDRATPFAQLDAWAPDVISIILRCDAAPTAAGPSRSSP